MSVPPPSWMPNSTSTGSPSSSVRSTTAVSNAITRVCSVGQRGQRRRRARRRGRRDAAMLPLWSRHRISSAASERRLRAVADEPLRDHRPVLGLVVAQVGADRAVPVDLAAAAAGSCARCGPARRARPRACGPRAAARCPRRPAARRCRATCRLASGSASRRLISVAARCTSGVTFSSTSGSSSSRCRPSRSIASCCTTRTTPRREVRAQLAQPARDDRRRLAQPAPPLAVDRVQRAVDPPVLAARGRTPVPSASSPPSTSRQRLQPLRQLTGPSSLATVSSARPRRAPTSMTSTSRGLAPSAFAEAFAEAAALGRRAGRRRRGAGAGGRW